MVRTPERKFGWLATFGGGMGVVEREGMGVTERDETPSSFESLFSVVDYSPSTVPHTHPSSHPTSPSHTTQSTESESAAGREGEGRGRM